MALGTLNPHAHKDLRHALGQDQLICRLLIEVGGRVLERPSVGSQKLLNHLVHRSILGDLFHQPVVVQKHRFVADLEARTNLEDLGPLVHPEFSKLFAAKKFVDHFGSLVRRLGIKERRGFRHSRCGANDVQINASQECLVVADLGWRHTQLLELARHQSIDIVRIRLLRVIELQTLRQNQKLRDDRKSLKPCHDKGFATVSGSHHSLLTDSRRGVVIGHEHSQTGHIPIRTVGILGQNRHALARSLTVQNSLLGGQFHADKFRQFRHIVVW